jgi:putative transposase
MSRNYKFHNPEGLYFVSFAVVHWIDVFVREEYCISIIESLNFCIKNKGMKLYAYCIMPSHIHLIFHDENNKPADLLGHFKSFTSKKLIKQIQENSQESRKEWLMNAFEKAGSVNSNNTKYQFWQQHNKPIELWSNKVIEQKLDYIHQNPVNSGFVNEAEHWKYSSALNYTGIKGNVELCLL